MNCTREMGEEGQTEEREKGVVAHFLHSLLDEKA